VNQSSPKSRLEARLRDHYRRRAHELTLRSMSWDDMVADRGAISTASNRSHRSRWLVAASVVTLVAGAAAGAVAMRSGDGGSAQVASAPTNPAGEAPALATEPPASSTPGPASPTTAGAVATTDTPLPENVITAALPDPDRPFIPCPTDTSLPADEAATVFPNDVRFDGMPLPEATPDGYCVIDHQAGAGMYVGSQYTVWASCADCAEPTAAIALIRAATPVTDDPSHVSNDPSQAPGAIAVPMGDGRGGFFIPPSETSAISTLYTTDAGGATVVLAGWGLEQGEFVAFAEAATTPGAALPGELVQVYDDALSGFWPGTLPTDRNLHVGYTNATGTEWLSYAVLYDGTTWPADTRLPLMALAWAAPNPVLTNIGDEWSIAFGPSAGDSGQQTMLVRTTPNSMVTWVSSGVEPMSVEELAAMPLTPAAHDDPRWAEIAHESGDYGAVG
jgi:hypothetical protein